MNYRELLRQYFLPQVNRLKRNESVRLSNVKKNLLRKLSEELTKP